MIKNTTLSLFAVAALWLFAAVSFADVVNINKADAAAFQQHLTGIGPVKAKAIVSYRSKNGPFEHIDDLKNVSGIGEELLKANRKSLSLTSGVSSATNGKGADKSAVKKETAAKTKEKKQTVKTIKEKKS